MLLAPLPFVGEGLVRGSLLLVPFSLWEKVPEGRMRVLLLLKSS